MSLHCTKFTVLKRCYIHPWNAAQHSSQKQNCSPDRSFTTVSVDKAASDHLVLVMVVTKKIHQKSNFLSPPSVHMVRSQQLTVLGCCLLTKSEIKSNSFCPRKSSGSSCTLSNPSSITSDVKTSSSIKSASMPLRLRAGPAICCMLLSWA